MPNISFTDLPRTPANHFLLYFYAAVLKVFNAVTIACGSHKEAIEKHPFLLSYHNELASMGLEGCTMEEAPRRWEKALVAWEESCTIWLPLRGIGRACGIDYEGLVAILCIGLVEEDGRFGRIFESALGPSVQRPTIGLLQEWCRTPASPGEYRLLLHRLLDAKIVEPVNPEAPWTQQMLHIHPALWRLLQGDTPSLVDTAVCYTPSQSAERLENLILPDDIVKESTRSIERLAVEKLKTLIIRGPNRNGRRTLAGAIARSIGRGILACDLKAKPDCLRAGVYATALNAVPLFKLDLHPGETVLLDRIAPYTGPVFIVMGAQGGIRTDENGLSTTLRLDIPTPALRRRHWSAVSGNGVVPAVLDTMRISTGSVRELAASSSACASLDNRSTVTDADVRVARSAWGAHTLERFAVPVKPFGTWSDIAAERTTMDELRLLEDRCRYREAMVEPAGRALRLQMTPGVRALFTGPSGTGKTLSARILASVLGMDLYRVDLSAIVNKYIGETEKNLNQVFTLAEEHDVVLLIDEGDALLTSRTNVQTANDRYANLETNFLLQRLEQFGGICVITTNAPERVDQAFMRRMDAIVNFRIPDTGERKAIWRIHLDHAPDIPDAFITEIASRCALTGGQIRNAVIHAFLLALRETCPVSTALLEAAIRREYMKTGAICPLLSRKGA